MKSREGLFIGEYWGGNAKYWCDKLSSRKNSPLNS